MKICVAGWIASMLVASCAQVRPSPVPHPNPASARLDRLVVVVDGVVQTYGPLTRDNPETPAPWMWSIEYALEPGWHWWEAYALVTVPCSAEPDGSSARFELRDGRSFGVLEKRAVGMDVRVVDSHAATLTQQSFGLAVDVAGIVDHLPYDDDPFCVPASCWIPERAARHLCTARSVLEERRRSLEKARAIRDSFRERCEDNAIATLTAALEETESEHDPSVEAKFYERFVARARTSQCMSGGRLDPGKSAAVVLCPGEAR